MAGQTLTAQPDDVGYWQMSVPTAWLEQQNTIDVSTQYKDDNTSKVTAQLPFLKQGQDSSMSLFPIAGNNVVIASLGQDIAVKGQVSGSKIQKITFKLDAQNYVAKIDKDGIFSTIFTINQLEKSPSHALMAIGYSVSDTVLAQQQLLYKTQTQASNLSIDLQPLALVDPLADHVVLQGKVIKNYSSTWLYFAIIIDNMASGLAGAAFIAFLSSLTSVSFTAVQYAIFSSLMTLTPKILGGYSGTIVSHVGYPQFFLMTTLMGIPILILVWWVARLLKNHQIT